jgi:CheY-like chemotaxis protein
MSTDATPIHRILVIDDNPAIHDDFRKILSPRSATAGRLGAAAAALFGRPAPRPDAPRFEIDCASRGQEGLDKVRAAACAGRPYSMAYVDVRMPNGWDGLETISRIWQEHGDLLVVICTAFSDHTWEENSRAARLQRPVPDSQKAVRQPRGATTDLRVSGACTN